jgi:hypothetical protein
MRHELPKLPAYLDATNATCKKGANVSQHMRALRDYINAVHAYAGGPDTSIDRVALVKALRALSIEHLETLK